MSTAAPRLSNQCFFKSQGCVSYPRMQTLYTPPLGCTRSKEFNMPACVLKMLMTQMCVYLTQLPAGCCSPSDQFHTSTTSTHQFRTPHTYLIRAFAAVPLLLQTAGMLSHPRVTQEIKDIWVDFLTQCDAQLGASISAKLQASQNGSAAPQPAEVSV